MGIKRTFIKNTSFNIASYAYLVIAALFSIPILVHALGVRVFGYYTLIISIGPILSVFDFGISQATIRFLALPDYDEKDKVKVWQTSFFFFALMGAALFLIVLGLFQFYFFRLPSVSSIVGERLPLMLVVATTVFLNHINAHFLTLPQAQSRYDIYSLNAFLAGSANTWIAALAALIRPDLLLIALVRLAGVILTLLVMWLYVRRHYAASIIPRFHRDSFGEMIGFGLKSFASRVFGAIEAYGLNFILASFVALQAVTYFSIPQSLIIKAAGGISMLTLSLFPLSTSLLTKEGIIKLKKLIIWLQAGVIGLGLFAVGVIFLFGKPLLLLWLGNQALVEQAYPILQILSLQLFLTSLTPMPTAVFESMNLPQIPALFAFLTVTLEFILIAILLPRFGVNGVAYAISGSAAITVPTFLLVFTRRFTKYEKTLTS